MKIKEKEFLVFSLVRFPCIFSFRTYNPHSNFTESTKPWQCHLKRLKTLTFLVWKSSYFVKLKLYRKCGNMESSSQKSKPVYLSFPRNPFSKMFSMGNVYSQRYNVRTVTLSNDQTLRSLISFILFFFTYQQQCMRLSRWTSGLKVGTLEEWHLVPKQLKP